MSTALLALSLLGFFIVKPVPCGAENLCPDGRVCPPFWLCCELGCCAPPTGPARREDDPHKEPGPAWYDTPWYTQWSVLFLLGTLGGIMVCCVWCLVFRRASGGVCACSLACCVRRPTSEHDSAGSVYPPPHYSRCGSFHQAPPPYSEVKRAWGGACACSLACCVRRPTSEHDSAGSVYPPPHYRRCGSFHQAPPSYSEVTSKPDLYPLVITCGDGDGKAGGNYLMVHYFRNYVIRAPGSLSATSTAESLNSSFICNAANEANSIVPPPYSCASNYSDCGAACGRSLLRSLSSLTERAAPAPAAPAIAAPARTRTTSETNVRSRDTAQAFRDNLITSPVQPLDPTFDLELELIDCEMCCDGGCKPRLGASPPAHRAPPAPPAADHDAFALRRLLGPDPEPPLPAACDSPPQPTSPTQSRDSTLRRPSDERRHRRDKKSRKSSLYMPLSVAYPVRTSRISPGSRASSRSAPATPCGALVPNLLTFTQRVSASRHGSRSSRFEEESNPLLAETDNPRTDHKF